MGDLTTILGIQLGQKLNDIQNAIGDGASYLAAQGRKGGQSTHPRMQQVSVPSHEGDVVLPDAALVSKDGNGVLGEGSMRPPVSYLPPAGGDRVVAPEQPLFTADPRKQRAYLNATVPVQNEKGQLVGTIGPKGVPMVMIQPQPEAVITPIPNAPADSLQRIEAPYLAPKVHKTKGVFLKHIKSMYEQMLQQMGTLT